MDARNAFAVLDTMPTVHLAIGLLLLTSAVIALGSTAARLLGRGPRWKSLAARGLVVALGAAIVLNFVVQAAWVSGAKRPLPVDLTVRYPAAQPITAILHPAVYLQPVQALDRSRPGTVRANAMDSRPAAAPTGANKPQWHESAEGIFDQAFLILWPIVIGVLGARQFIARIVVDPIRREAAPAEGAARAHGFEELCKKLGIAVGGPRSPRVFAGRRVYSPFASGVFQPAIIIPAAMLYADDSQLRLVLARELAHVKRCDPLFAVAMQAICAVCWFNPLVWWFANQVECVAEEAADADVLDLSDVGAPAYARLLCSIAEGRVHRLTEAVAGVGMMPSQPALAGRVKMILSYVKFGSVVTGNRRAALIAALAATGVLTAGICIVRYEPAAVAEAASATPAWVPRQDEASHYRLLAMHPHWSVGPVYVPAPQAVSPAVTLLVPSPLSQAQETVDAELNMLSSGLQSAPGYRPPMIERQTIERVLAKNPRQFYAEALLSEWYRNYGQTGLAAKWLSRALADAPVVLAGRLCLPDGRPVPQFPIILSVSLLFSESRAYPGTLLSCQYNIRTDRSGCYYLPVYAAPAYSLYSGVTVADNDYSKSARLRRTMSLESGSSQLSTFTVRTRVALLPPSVLRPNIVLRLGTVATPSLEIPDDSRIAGSFNRPLVLSGHHADLTWRPVANATCYQITIGELIAEGPHSSRMVSIAVPGVALLDRGADATSYRLDLGAGGPGFVSGRTYQIFCTAYRVKTAEGRTLQHSLSNSPPIYFRVADAPQRLPLTVAVLAGMIGPDASVVSIDKSSREATVVIDNRGPDFGYSNWQDRQLFGYRTSSQVTRILRDSPVVVRITVKMSR